MKKNIFWFRRDLRLEDNTALAYSLLEQEDVIPIFIFDDLKKSDEFQKWVTDHLDEIIKAAQSTGEVTKGFAKANATLNPFVIAGYAISAAGIISSIASAFKATKKASQAAGVSGGGSLSAAPQAPSFNVVGQQSAGEQAIGSRLEALQGGGLKAYVVEEEITNAQQNQGAVNDAASLG